MTAIIKVKKIPGWVAIGVLISVLALLMVGCVSASEYEALEEEKNGVQMELEASQSDVASLEAMLEASQSDVASLRAVMGTLRADLADLKEMCPPRNFKGRYELSRWREQTGVVGQGLSYVDACLRLQEVALSDGYLLSMDIDLDGDYWGVSLTAIAGENFYQVWPDEIELVLVCPVY